MIFLKESNTIFMAYSRNLIRAIHSLKKNHSLFSSPDIDNERSDWIFSGEIPRECSNKYGGLDPSNGTEVLP
jgi:hypothetical protein